ncbi:hypothetical protein D3C80_1820150 [compost metagenome]
MGFGSQVHHDIRLVLAEHPLHGATVADIHLLEGIACAGTDLGQRVGIAGVGQFVEIDHAVFGLVDELADDGRADKAGAAGDEDLHGASRQW